MKGENIMKKEDCEKCKMYGCISRDIEELECMTVREYLDYYNYYGYELLTIPVPATEEEHKGKR